MPRNAKFLRILGPKQQEVHAYPGASKQFLQKVCKKAYGKCQEMKLEEQVDHNKELGSYPEGLTNEERSAEE